MAIVDLNSRYGTYADDAAIGGYNRKELRGLSKQARRGTLTQRERARLKYLTDERKGRRKRGLLAGLGGAAATLGGLALAGKLGKGEGKGGGGAALMDAIKLRLAEGKEKRMRRRADPMEEISSLGAPKKEERGLVGGERTAESPAPMSLKDLDEATPAADLIKRIQTGANVDDVLEKIEQDDVKQRVSAAGEPAQDFSDVLSEDVGEGTLSSLRDHYNMMKADEAEKAAEEQRLRMLFDSNPTEMPEGPVAEGGMSPMVPGPETTDLPQRLIRLARASSEMEPDVDQYPAPNRAGASPTRGSNRPNVRKLLNALTGAGRSPEDARNRRVVNTLADQQKRVLDEFNKMRADRGLDPVDELSEEVISEMEALKSGMSKGGAIKNSLRNSMNNRYR